MSGTLNELPEDAATAPSLPIFRASTEDMPFREIISRYSELTSLLIVESGPGSDTSYLRHFNKNSSGDEIANVNFFFTTSHM